MSSSIVRSVLLNSGKHILVETYEVETSRDEYAVGEAAVEKKAVQTLESTLSDLEPVFSSVVTQLKALAPDKIEVKLGIKISGELAAIVAKTSAEANFEITLSWENSSEGKAAGGSMTVARH